MTAAESLPTFTQEASPQATSGRTSEAAPVLPEFAREPVLEDPNQPLADATGIEGKNNGIESTASATLRYEGSLPVLPSLGPVRVYFNALQKWEGRVVDVRGDTFIARLMPIEGEGQVQQAEILLDELARDELDLVEPGAVFYWSVGYEERPSGRVRQSVIRFRRLPPWTSREIKTAQARSSELRMLLDGE